ncbi:MAG: hypothetical protein HQM04_17070 [Magnetococcales bacterium]|nr:hypothetical protein [Magnetococcales bacterium]MBF0116743.1 hypothetical protein [Magnetococcales bacterium]
MTKKEITQRLETDGFAEIAVEEDMVNGANYTASCSGSRSDCCTRVCSQDATFAGTNTDWEHFLLLNGGEVQY